MDLLAANFPKFPTFRLSLNTDSAQMQRIHWTEITETHKIAWALVEKVRRKHHLSPLGVITTWFLLLFNMCLGPLFCLAGLSLSSLSSSLYLSSYPLPLHSRFTLSPPPDKATIVPQMLFNMESLSVSLCRATHRQKWGHFLLCFASLHIFCAIIFVLNNQYESICDFLSTATLHPNTNSFVI